MPFLGGRLGDILKKVPNLLGDVASGALEIATGANPLEVVKDRIVKRVEANDELTPEEKEIALAELEAELEREAMILKDRISARESQTKIATSAESTKLSKNFIYYFAMGVGFLMFTIIIMMFFIEIPVDNRRIIDVLLGGFVTILSSIGSYFFGSSTGSKNKESIIGNVMQKK